MTRLTEAELREVLATHEVISDTGSVDMKRIHAGRETVPTEHEEQAALFAWADSEGGDAALLYANVNGQYRKGQRPEAGLRAGIPDVFLPVARNGQHGLYIELKRTKGAVVSDEQLEWLRVLEGQGYAVGVSYGASQAIATIKDYLFGGGDG